MSRLGLIALVLAGALSGCGRTTMAVAKAEATEAFPTAWSWRSAKAAHQASARKPEATGGRSLELAVDTEVPKEIYARSHAVVIGIDAYQHVPRLTGAVRDAKSVAAALESRGFEVTTLLDRQSTRGGIAELLADRLPQQLGAQDRVLVFFAGHGVSTGEGAHRMGYLLPVEGKRDSPRSSSISMSELQQWLAGYPAKHVLFVADACYSGLALSTRSVGIDPTTASYLHDVTRRKVRFTLVAGRDDQQAHEHADQGVFTRFFLEGIAGRADHNRDGLVTSDELAAFVKPQVSTFVGQTLHGAQTPQSARSGLGEFVFFAGE